MKMKIVENRKTPPTLEADFVSGDVYKIKENDCDRVGIAIVADDEDQTLIFLEDYDVEVINTSDFGDDYIITENITDKCTLEFVIPALK